MSAQAKFRMPGREISREPLHYTLSGLDDIYLLNGFKRHETPYGHGVSIEKADELHRVIGRYLITNRKVLSPKEVRFLRKNMNLTQEELGDCLGVTSQTVARYEKGTDIPGPADRLLRVLYVFMSMPKDHREKLVYDTMERVKEMQRLDEPEPQPVYFGSSKAGWKARALEVA